MRHLPRPVLQRARDTAASVSQARRSGSKCQRFTMSNSESFGGGALASPRSRSFTTERSSAVKLGTGLRPRAARRAVEKAGGWKRREAPVRNAAPWRTDRRAPEHLSEAFRAQ